MSFKAIKNLLLCSSIVIVSGCSTLLPNLSMGGNTSFSEKETFYKSTNNYDGLISLYRKNLKNKENSELRYKLSEAYYAKGDISSSLFYLKSLLKGKSKINQSARILEVKNLIQLGKYQEAINDSSKLLMELPKNAEVYNLRGIAYAQLGNLAKARSDINKAREFFINDITAVNNLAMLSIINGDYRNAVSLLLPQYSSGVKDSRLLHNLVFSLIKMGDVDYAKDIIVKENLDTSADNLINALKKTEKKMSSVRK